MRIGFVGLGKMGAQIVAKLRSAGHELVVLDVDPTAVEAAAKLGAEPAVSREDLVQKLGNNPIVWLMIPDAFVEAEVQAFAEILPAGSLLIDGGNSRYTETIRRADVLASRNITYMDVGTSGGVMGLTSGFSLMVGGDKATYSTIEPLLNVLAQPSGGVSYMGPSGYGHYVKMIHNGIEYGMMQAYAEGYDLLKYGPLPDVDLAAAAHVWQEGSIIASTLNGLTAEILDESPELDGIDGYVADSGEGRWTKETAEQANIPMPVLDVALDVRKQSQAGKVYYATKLLAAMRNKFGGHAINKASK